MQFFKTTADRIQTCVMIEIFNVIFILTWEVPWYEHGSEDGSFQLSPGVELLQAFHRLLAMDNAGDALPLLKSEKNQQISFWLEVGDYS